MTKKPAKLSLSRETLLVLGEAVEHAQGGMRPIDTSQTGTYRPTTGPNCIKTSVSICNTNCGCVFR